MFAGTHKFAKRLFLPTECALDQFRLRRVNLRFGASQHSPLIRGVVTRSAGCLDSADIMIETCTRGRGSLALLFALIPEYRYRQAISQQQ